MRNACRSDATAEPNHQLFDLLHRKYPNSESVEELIKAIFDYIDLHNENPKPFIWTAKTADILEKVERARTALHNR
jgi:hypothetical protein